MSEPFPGERCSVEVARLSADEWTGVLAAFDDAVIYQTWQYGAQRWGAGNLSHVVVRRDGNPIAAAQVAEAGVPRMGVGVCYVPWGPLLRPRGGEQDPAAFAHVIRAMRDKYCREMGLSLRVRPQAEEGADGPFARALAAEGFERLLSPPPHRTLVMDLTLPLESIRRGVKRPYAQHYKRALKSGIDVAEGTGSDLLHAFLELYGEMKARKSFEGLVDPTDFALVQEGLPELLKMTTTVCYCRAEPVSALVTSAIGDTGVGLFAASSPKGRDTCAAYLMWWRTVERLKAEGRRRLDLGGIDPETAPGPAQFKSRLAGKTGREALHVGHFEAPGGLASRLCVRVGLRLRNACRRVASAARSCLRAAAGARSAVAGRGKPR